MPLMTENMMVQYIKDNLGAGIVNIELSDDIIKRNLRVALMLSSDYFNYTDYVTLPVTQTTGSGGHVELSSIDPYGIPVILKVYPTTNVMNVDAALLGLGSIYINMGMSLTPQMTAYSNMLQRLANLENILGRNARVVGSKLYVDHYWSDVTIEFIPNVVDIEHINEGAWITFLLDYTTALCKRQIAQSRGKYVVSSNPATMNAEQLINEANESMASLREGLLNKGALLTRR